MGIELMKQGEAGFMRGQRWAQKLRDFSLRGGGLLVSVRELDHIGSGPVPWQCSRPHCGQYLGHKGTLI